VSALSTLQQASACRTEVCSVAVSDACGEYIPCAFYGLVVAGVRGNCRYRVWVGVCLHRSHDIACKHVLRRPLPVHVHARHRNGTSGTAGDTARLASRTAYHSECRL